MALEDFERQLAQERAENNRSDRQKRKRSRSPADKSDKHRHRHRHHHHHHGRPRENWEDEEGQRYDYHRKHGHSSRNETEGLHKRRTHQSQTRSASPSETEEKSNKSTTGILKLGVENQREKPQRMSWMQTPSDDIEHVHSRRPKTPPGYFRKGLDIKRTLDGDHPDTRPLLNEKRIVDYTFGDAGSDWRMKKLKGIYREAKQSGRRVEDIAVQRYGDLRTFDEAREEEAELDRRQMYSNHKRKEKPSGELYRDRKIQDEPSEDEFEIAQGQPVKEISPQAQTLPLDQNAIDKIEADMSNSMKATNMDSVLDDKRPTNTKKPDVVVLNKMENRMLTGNRKGEVVPVATKRGRERGLVEENEDMSIEDMVRQERRTKGQFGGDGRAFAERIAKDTKFDNDLDYMDENAEKLAKSVQKSDINLKTTAIGDYKKMKRILNSCPLCTHEDTGEPPKAPTVSLATRTYLTLPTSPEITPYGYCASIIPIQHRLNLLQCDDDEWEEIRNFMKSLTRFFYSLKPKRSVIFYENAAHEGRKRHASMEAVPLPISIADNISQYFKEAILSADEEWTQHKKVIDTLKKSEEAGFGKNGFRKSMVSELPYFHVWFRLDGGLGHVVEDSRRWPKGDLFAREIIGGVLDVPPQIIKKQGRWRTGDEEMQERVKNFRKGWEQWDWTKVLMDAQ